MPSADQCAPVPVSLAIAQFAHSVHQTMDERAIGFDYPAFKMDEMPLEDFHGSCKLTHRGLVRKSLHVHIVVEVSAVVVPEHRTRCVIIVSLGSEDSPSAVRSG